MHRASNAEAEFHFQLRAAGIDGWTTEHRFHPTRRWRFDVAFESRKLAVEIDGLSWRGAGGRHQRGKGFEADCEKMNEAMLLGWRVLRVSQGQVSRGDALRWLRRALAEM